ncbi:hypothetical protein [Rhabdaerophilum sp. SD176]|uniref:hypothetical protein n=1 Tax=Rhabdaerophilum sp. SD176 TaxID=2983548 RepID=UPI0024E04053|nr:hypothetical protein [Rhabdaerophilum sp. SD176]
MPKPPENSQKTPETSLQAVLDAVSIRSAFAMALPDRIDRLQLIETTLATWRDDADAKLVQELHSRRTETLLALASYATSDEGEFQIKAAAIGGDFDLPDGKITDQHLVIIMILTALSADGRQHGIELQVSRKTSAKDEVKRPH